MNKGINPSQFFRLIRILGPIMKALGEGDTPESVHTKILAFDPDTKKTFDTDKIPSDLKSKVKFMVTCKAVYSELEHAESFLKVDKLIDEV